MLKLLSELGWVRSLGALLCGLFILAGSFFFTLWLLDRSSTPETPQPFEVGTPVTTAGNAATLAATGRQIQLFHAQPGGKVVGAVENLNPEADGALKVSGWAISPDDKSPAQYVIAISNGKLLSWSEPDLRRADIAAGVGAAYARSGFAFRIPKLPPPQIKSLEVYAVSKAGMAYELNYSSAFR